MNLPLIAYILASIPLVAGTATFFLWRITRQDWLMVMGVMILGLGLIFVMVSAGLLTIYGRQHFKSPTKDRRWMRKLFVGLVLILANFPLALLYMTHAIQIESLIQIKLTNQSQVMLETIQIDCRGDIQTLTSLAPGAQHTLSCTPIHEGSLDIRFQAQNKAYTQEAGYVAPGMSGGYQIQITPDFQVDLETTFQP